MLRFAHGRGAAAAAGFALWRTAVAVGAMYLLFRLGFAIIGAFAVNGARTYFTAAAPEIWLFFLGALFILVTLAMPKGIVGVYKSARSGALTEAVGRRLRRADA